ncbi:hypothetical protein PMAYCL1PPCAC_05652, partial [Pristionchus mayeri]
GALTSFANVFLCILIAVDKDPRGKAFRKYIFSLQVSVTALDLLTNAYAVICPINCRLVYSDSALAHNVAMLTAIMVHTFTMCEIAISYSNCIYYKRKEIPAIVSWIKTKPTFIVFHAPRMNYSLGITLTTVAFGISTIIILMVFRVVIDVQLGVINSSVATKRYQSRVIFSLVMQGVVPSCFFAVPTAMLVMIFINGLHQDEFEAANDRTVSTISVLTLSMMSWHGLAHSLTILACSSTYRKFILTMPTAISRAMF